MIKKKVFVTKYALTHGIKVGTYEPSATDGYGHVGSMFVALGRDCFNTEAEAKKRVHQLIAAKRKSLKNAAAALDKLERDLGDYVVS